MYLVYLLIQLPRGIISSAQAASEWPQETQNLIQENPAPQDIQTVLNSIFYDQEILELFSTVYTNDVYVKNNYYDLDNWDTPVTSDALNALEKKGFQFKRMDGGLLKKHIFTHKQLPGYFFKTAEYGNDTENLSRVALASHVKKQMALNNITNLIIPNKYVYVMPTLEGYTPTDLPRILICAEKIDLTNSLTKVDSWLHSIRYPGSLHSENLHYLDNGKAALIDTEAHGDPQFQYDFERYEKTITTQISIEEVPKGLLPKLKNKYKKTMKKVAEIRSIVSKQTLLLIDKTRADYAKMNYNLNNILNTPIGFVAITSISCLAYTCIFMLLRDKGYFFPPEPIDLKQEIQDFIVSFY